MRFSVYLLSVIVVFLVAGALPLANDAHLSVFRTPVFIGLLVLLAGALTHCSLRRRGRFRGTAFRLCHLGAAAVLIGAFARFLWAVETQFAVPIGAAHPVDRLPADDGSNIDPGFSLAVHSFAVEFYPPTYSLYTPPALDPTPDERPHYQHVGTARIRTDGVLDGLGDRRVHRDDLRDDNGDWMAQLVLPDGSLLQRNIATPKRYVARLELRDSNGVTAHDLEVNRPAQKNGWRFHLMSYDTDSRRYVVLSARNDPGRRLVIAGIWGLILGTAGLCWQPGRRTRAVSLAAGDRQP